MKFKVVYSIVKNGVTIDLFREIDAPDAQTAEHGVRLLHEDPIAIHHTEFKGE